MEINLKLKIENLDEITKKVEEIKKLVDEFNKISIKVSVETNEVTTISEIAKEIKKYEEKETKLFSSH